MTYKQQAWTYGLVTLILTPLTMIVGLTNTRVGFILWILGCVVLAYTGWKFGYAYGRCCSGRGHERSQ